MPNWQPIQKNKHQNAQWQAYQSYDFAKHDATAPLLMAEIASAIPFYPMAFVKTPQEQFQFVAVQSLQPQKNLFLTSQGKWRVPYVPSIYRGYPFKMLPSQTGEHVLCVDQDSALFYEKKAPSQHSNENTQVQALFDEAGALSAPMQKVVNFLQQCEKNRTATQAAVDALDKAALITPWPIQAKVSDNEQKPIHGLYKIDQSQLHALTGDTLHHLNQLGSLSIAHGQLLSMARLKGLTQLYQMQQAEQKKSQPQEVDLEKLFGEEEDSLKF